MVKTHPRHFRVAFPPRDINNVYFDTPGLGSYRIHVNGAAARRKFRIRWYGEPYGRIERPVLEVKAKNGVVGTKTHVVLDPFEFDGSLDTAALTAADGNPDGHGALLATLGVAQPTLFNRYNRRYWVTTDERFRVTIDTGLTYRVVNGRRHSVHSKFLEERLAIIELKYDVEDDAAAKRILQFLPFRPEKYSKYISGVSRLGCLSEH
jgi:hypothetical protein